MDVFSFLSYINKVSLFAFFVTTLVVAYQIYNLRKEKSKDQTPIIPDFKEGSNFNTSANFTRLPSSLTKKELKAVNYSKLVFLIISLLTVIIVIFVVSLIKKNSHSSNQTSNNPPAITSIISPTIIQKNEITPALKNNLTITPMEVVPTVDSQPTVEPTEIILAKSPSLVPTTEPEPTETVINKPQVLPETSSWEKGFLIIGVAISAIFFSFWF